MDQTTDILLTLGSSPIAIAAAIILATFVLEDLATVAAALLAAAGVIPAPVAIAALFVGIFAGDLALYGLGAAARTRPWAHAWIGETRIERGRAWLQQRLIGALIGARFLPGFRLPVYAASGFLRVPFSAFAAITAIAVIAWTAAIFALVFAFGAMILDELGTWKWAAGGAVLLALAAPTIANLLRAKHA